MNITTDYLIIGSGFGAAAPALRLVESGHQVLMIEKGKNIRGKQDFSQTQDPKYLQQYLKGLSGKHINFTYAEALGGGSGFYEMVSLRAPGLAFSQKNENGDFLWPGNLNREMLNPYYDLAEEMLNVTQIPEDKVPKSGIVFAQLMNNLGYSCDRARYAVQGCLGSGFCISGCIFGAKQSLHYNYLHRAISLGLELKSDLSAMAIQPFKDPLQLYRFRVLCKDENGGRKDILCKTLILGAGTVGTAKLLLNSREWMPDLSTQVGKNICFNGSVKAAAMLPDGFIEGDMFAGMTHPGMISYHFLESHGMTISSAKPLPISLVSSSQFNLKGQSKDSFWGRSNEKFMKNIRKRMIVLYALGFHPETAEIKKTGADSFDASLKITKRLERYYKDTYGLLESIFELNGCTMIEVQKFNSKWKETSEIQFSSAHMTGSCRMAESEKSGVVNSNGEVFGYEGLFISDGSAIPGSLAVNTSLTILANAERIANYINSKT